MKSMMTAIAALTMVLGASACNNKADSEAPAAAAAATGITGTWTVDLASAQWDNSNSKYVIADGTYNCESCLPPYSFAADGQWQKVDRPGADEMMVKIVDDKTIEFASRFEGKDQGKSTWTVSDDGNAMTIDWTNYEDGGTITGKTNLTRAAAGPDGSHAASGEWTPANVSEMSEEGRTVTITEEGETIKFESTGGSYTAKLGGDPVAIEGDKSGVMVAIAKTGDNTYRETLTRKNETIGVNDWTVEGDKVTVVASDPRDNSKVTWSATRK